METQARQGQKPFLQAFADLSIHSEPEYDPGTSYSEATLGAKRSLPKVDVLFWDSSSVGVSCIFCLGIHRHGFTGYGPETSRRRCHCRCGERYQFAFPFDETSNQAYYTIDKKRALFVAAGADPSEYFNWSEENPYHCALRVEVSRTLATKRKWCEATETINFGAPESDPEDYQVLLSFILSELILGNLQAVREYLESSKEADLFLFGIEAYYIRKLPPSSLYPDDADFGDKQPQEQDDQHETLCVTGNTALHFAACEKNAEMVKLLLDKGANPNARDKQGMTPLAHACLWGRLESVRYLLQYGADKTILSVRNECSKLLLAVDYARESKDNIQDRHWQVGEGYIEDTYERNKDRRVIVALLNDPADRRLDNNKPRKLWRFAFTKAPHDTNMVTMRAQFDIDNEWKTVGVLWRGEKFPTVAAMSGWAHPERDGTRVAGRDWTDEVLRLCKEVGFDLTLHHYDRGTHGQYHACHAEKQLIAYFVDQHYFLLYDRSSPNDEERWSQEERENLLAVKPPVTVTKAKIMVSREVCCDCRDFVQHINKTMGLQISVIAGAC